MNLDNLTKEQITTLIRCLHEVIMETSEDLAGWVTDSEGFARVFEEMKKYLQEVRQLHALLVGYKNEKWGIN